jgi:O-antigen/teichoic acid export membrane protein
MESRTKKSLLNIRVNLICYFIGIIVAFLTRRVFLQQLGSEFVGLTSTLQSLLGFLNIAELGIGTAIAYFLYKPLFDNDRNKIVELISVFGYLYRIIGSIIFLAGIILSLFLPSIFKDTSFSTSTLYIGFYSFLFSALLGYYVNYKQILLAADQRNYEVTGYNQAVISIKGIVQMFLALKYQNFTIYFILEAAFGVVYSVILNWRIQKIYPWLVTNVIGGYTLLKNYPEIWKKISQIFIHKIGGFFQFQFLPILIYSYVSLPVVALYTNYTTITLSIRYMMNAVLSSTNAGIGSLVAEGDKVKVYNVFKQLFSVNIFLVGILTTCIYELSSEFVTCWLGRDYILNNLVVCFICVQLFLSLLRTTVEQFINAYGLFGDVWAPIVESILFVAFSVIFGSIWGLEGILIGPIASTFIIIYLWKPYYLFTRGLKISVFKYWMIIVKHICITIFSYILSKYVIANLFSYIFVGENMWLNFITHSLLFFISMSMVTLITTLLLSKDFREICQVLIKHRIK